MSRLALVLSAGGARGAYEAGVIHYLRTNLPKHLQERNFEIFSGTSVGAINTALLASTAQDPIYQGKSIKDIWLSIRQAHVYRRDLSATTHFLGSTLGGLMRNLLTFNPFHLANRSGPHFESFLDTSPLKTHLKKIINWKQISKNILKGPTDAVAINVTNLTNGRNELFFQKKPSLKYMGHYIHKEGPIKPEHIMASASIPIIFPPEKIGKVFYADGGLRLFTPMSPAIQLGAEKLIVIGLRRRVPMDKPYYGLRTSDRTPTIPEQMGRLMNGLFLDRIEFDMEQLARINAIIESSEKMYGKNYLKKLNAQMKKDGYELDIAHRGLRKIKAVEIQPSQFINNIFMEWFERVEKTPFKFSALEKLLVRILDIDPHTGSDLLSYLIFAPDYLRILFELGFQDGKRQKKELIDIMED